MNSIRHYARDRSGAAAVEFALVAGLLILTILFVMTVAMILFVNQAIDYATTRASRQVMTGSAQAKAMDQAGFRKALCGYLPAMREVQRRRDQSLHRADRDLAERLLQLRQVGRLRPGSSRR